MTGNTKEVVFTDFHVFCGIGACAKGFRQANPRVGNLRAKFSCLGGIDVDPNAVKDFKKFTGVDGTVLDLFSLQQYRDWHGKNPPPNWREATVADIRNAARGQYPDVLTITAPCKGFSGLLSEALSKSVKYQSLNQLTLRGFLLCLEAFKENPPGLILFENVPRIATGRGRRFLDQINGLLSSYGYASAETTHNCGELGGLAQSRKRFLLVARHIDKVPPFLYEPEKKQLQSVGSILSRMPMPGSPEAGPMHRMPKLHWKTWVRLAFIEAGSDWRSLKRLAVENGYLRDYLLVPEYRSGYLGVTDWDQPASTIAGRSTASNGAFSVADPRVHDICPHNPIYKIVEIGSADVFPSNKVANPCPDWQRYSTNLSLIDWNHPSGTVIAGGKGVQGGCLSVADPRLNLSRDKGDHYLTAGHYGVTKWDEHCGAVSAAAGYDNGKWSIADPRVPAADEKTTSVIIALDGTHHRPFTTLEVAALQSLIEPEEYLLLEGLNDADWRERIGNAIPPKASAAIAEVMGTTLLLAGLGETFLLSSQSIWVRNIALALSVQPAQNF